MMSQNPAPSVSSAGANEIPSLPAGVTITTLENGLIIIVREDHSAPVVSAQAWCMAGSVHEGRWLGAGLSHVLEHMLFKGTTRRSGARIDQEVQEAGGYMNAYTSFDRTVYHIDVPSTGSRVALDILSDIMQNATLPPEEMEKEKQVILREMDMNVDDPGRRAGRRLFETAYTRSPYRFTIIGYPDIFHELRPEDIRGYYQEKYAPNNVFFVVVGDINREEVVAQVREAYAKTKSRALPPVVLPSEPPQTAPREVIEEGAVELGHFHFAWHIPDLRHADVPALDVLAAVLGNGRSSRLYANVRDRLGLVTSIDAWTYSPGLPGLFGVSASVDEHHFAAAREAILAEVGKLQQAPPTAAEIAKAVKQFVSGTLASRKTMQGQAQDLGGSWLAASDLNFSQRYLAAVQRVSAGDLLRVAKTYLGPENRTLFALLPTGANPERGHVEEISTDHPIQRFELENGLRLLVKESHRLPFVEFRAAFRGGVLAETARNQGVSQLMGKMLLKGTRRRTADEIALAIESVGGSIDSYAGNNSFGVNAEVMSGDFDLALELLAEVLLQPTFPEAALEREREVQMAAVRAQRDHLLQSTFKAMRRTLFGERGYGLDTLGSEESLGSLAAQHLKSLHTELVRPNNGVLAVFGDVQAEAVYGAVKKAFVGWEQTDRLPTLPPPTSLQSVQRHEECRDKRQAVVVVGFPSVTLESPERYALDLLQEACSDLGSRLFMRVREKLGLAYYVGAQHLAGLSPGYFAFYAGTMPESVALVEQELLKEAKLLCEEGLTAEELARAKAKLIGQRKISRQDLGALAATVSLDELYGLGHERYQMEDVAYGAVTLEQAQAVAGKYLRTDACVIAVARPRPAEDVS